VPDTAEARPPLLVFLHGATGTGHSHGRAVLAAADRYGVAVVAPDSRHGQTWDIIAARAFGPDVAHLDRVLDAVVERLDVDTDRIAVGGVSDGASYALSMGLTNGDVFGTVIAFSPGFLAVLEPHGRPRVFVSHGLADPILPFESCSGTIVPMLREAGYEVELEPFDGGHTVPPEVADAGVRWWLEGA
jgi:phospholipase/carboxylesterase